MNQDQTFGRRTLLVGAAIGGASMLIPQSVRADGIELSLPVGLPDRMPGDGFYIRHGFMCENTWFAPNWWHTGENWYLLDGDSAGAEVYATTDGVVVYAAFDYPGRVVIVEHADGYYSMYGHLAYELPVVVGQEVARGQRLGWLLDRTDGRAPSHLHFEIRDFLTNPIVNGDTPRYELGCGYKCPPGPGYWPMIDADLPVAFGWMNPMHAIAHHPANGSSEVRVNAAYAGEQLDIASQPGGRKKENLVESIRMEPGTSYELLSIQSAPEDSDATSAWGYEVWYEISYGRRSTGWVRVTKPSHRETGNDGRPSAIDLMLISR